MNASTRSDGRLTVVVQPGAAASRSARMPPTIDSTSLRSAVDSDVSADLVVARAAQAVGDHRADLVGRALADRAGDHPGLAEPAAARAAAEHLDVEAVVDDLGQRDELVLRVRPLPEVGDRALVDGRRDVGEPWRDRGDRRAVVGHLVQRRHVHARHLGEVAQHGVAIGATAARSTPPTTSVISPTTSSPSPSTTRSTKSASGSGLNAEWPPIDDQRVLGPRGRRPAPARRRGRSSRARS